MALFKTKSNKGEPRILARALTAVRSHLNNHGVNPDVTKYALSTESLNDMAYGELDSYQTSMKMSLESIIQDIGNEVEETIAGEAGDPSKYTSAQVEAGVAAAVIGADPVQAMSAPAPVASPGGENVTVFDATGVADAIVTRPGVESYDEKANRDTIAFSVTYNMQAARQDDFGEAFFPTVVVTPDQFGYSVVARLINLMDDVKRDISGKVTAFNRVNILNAAIDPTLMKNNDTAIIPVYRAQAAQYFVPPATIPTQTFMQNGEAVPTGPLKVGTTFDLLAISQLDSLLASGVQDITDSLDPTISVKNIYVKAGANILKLPTTNIKTFNFAPNTQGEHRSMVLNAHTSSIILNKNTKAFDGANLTEAALAAISTQNLIVSLSVQMGGQVLLDVGSTTVFSGTISVASVKDQDGNEISLTASPAKELVGLFNTAGNGMIGYDLNARRTNLNHRQRGQLMDTTYHTNIYSVPLLSPMTVLRPIGASDQTDAGDLATLITATQIRTNAAAVDALLSAEGTLASYTDTRLTGVNAPTDLLGVGSYLVNPVYLKDSIDMSTDIDSIKSQERSKDLTAVLINKIRDMVYRMYTLSNYKTAADAQAGGAAPLPTVIIGTDPIIARYLMLEGDLRTLGLLFDVKVVATMNKRMANKILFTFGYFGGQFDGVPNALHFGNMAWKPELTYVIPKSINGQVSKELTVAPSFRHLVNLPILGSIDVANIPNALKKIAVNTHQI